MKYITGLKGRLRSLWGSKKTTHNLVEVFTHEGHTYYRFPKEVNLPLERFSMSMSLLERLSSGVSGAEMELILGEMEKALGAGINPAPNALLISSYLFVVRTKKQQQFEHQLLAALV